MYAEKSSLPLLYIGYFKISVQNTSASLIDKDVLIRKENVIETIKMSLGNPRLIHESNFGRIYRS